MVRIRLRRVGRKNAPMFRIVVADSESPRDGRFIEVIGQYSPRETAADGKGKGRLSIRTERAHYWLDVGAQPSDTVRSLLRRAGLLRGRHEARIAEKRRSSAVPLSEDAGGSAAAGR
jgi:small subunit ribosomal protein S16